MSIRIPPSSHMEAANHTSRTPGPRPTRPKTSKASIAASLEPNAQKPCALTPAEARTATPCHALPCRSPASDLALNTHGLTPHYTTLSPSRPSKAISAKGLGSFP